MRLRQGLINECVSRSETVSHPWPPLNISSEEKRCWYFLRALWGPNIPLSSLLSSPPPVGEHPFYFQEVLWVFTWPPALCHVVGNYPQWQRCLCRGDVRKRKSPQHRREPQQTQPVTQNGISGGKDKASWLFSDQGLTEFLVRCFDSIIIWYLKS